MKHATPAVREGHPAIDVKDHTLWAQLGETAEAYAELAEDHIESLYEQALARFWADVELLAQEAGYDFHQDGRSGGWLVVEGPRSYFLDLLSADDPFSTADDDLLLAEARETEDEYVPSAIADRDHFMVFAQAVDTAMGQAGDFFLELLRDAVSELHAARENAIVRGEN